MNEPLLESGKILYLKEHTEEVRKQNRIHLAFLIFLIIVVLLIFLIIVVLLIIAGLIYFHETNFIYYVIKNSKTINPVGCKGI